LTIASLLGSLSVALGAFAAHKLKEILPADSIVVFETGVRYQFYHVFALLAVAILSERFKNKWITWSGNCFIIGIVLFSGSLYLLTFLRFVEFSRASLAGIVTPFGGLFLIAGWLMLMVAVSKK